jgi:predicted  nucleic acid-binding Zn-ribbon protein
VSTRGTATGGGGSTAVAANAAASTAAATAAAATAAAATAAAATPALSGAALRDRQKEIASIERRLARLGDEIDAAKNSLATHDHSDYQGLSKRMKEITALEGDVQALEERWFELTELIG